MKTITKTSLLMLSLLVAAVSCNNVDTKVPIRRNINGLRDFDYFGYTIVLHQLQNNPSTRTASLDQTRIIVSAPMFNIPGAAVENTGAVYSCPVNPGTCTPFTGTPLYDTTSNNVENKTNQFLGSAMASNGDNFIVCANRYKSNSPAPSLRGRCFYSDRSLSTFSAYSPCDAFGSTSASGTGLCQAGSSAVVTEGGVFGVGQPGSYLWRGSVTRRESQTSTTDSTTRGSNDPFSFIGYSMTTGRFISSDSLDYAVSLPRFSQNTYLGRVSIISNSRTLSVSNQPLNGQQMGEYYGFSVLGANLAGDSLDELIVGAPMYRADGTNPDTGRVFIYSNTNGALSLVRIIVGKEKFSRFGHALANLGDISGDGQDDIAISAPFGSGPGTVYIYYSSSTQTLNPQPQQTILGTSLSLSVPTANLAGFGSSLASGVDVDGNQYNDLAIGSFISQEVYLLRTRPLARVTSVLSTNRPIVDLDVKDCMYEGISYNCFIVTTCLTYTGVGVNSNLDLTVNLVAERQNTINNLEQRIFFAGSTGTFPTTTSYMTTASSTAMQCNPVTAYVVNGITDRFNGFIIDIAVTTTEFNPAVTDGNQAPLDLSPFPVITTSGQLTIQIETLKSCPGGTCVPDLQVSENSVEYRKTNGQITDRLTVGGISRINVQVDVANAGNDAFQATLSFTFATNQLQVERVYNITSDLTLTCVQETFQNESSFLFTRFNCSIGNPLRESANLPINIAFSPRAELVGNEGSLLVDLFVGSVNPEVGTLADNTAQVSLLVNAVADVSIGVPGLVTPESVSYSNNIPNNTVKYENATQLGPSVQATFTVSNGGPTTVPRITLSINWPFDGVETGVNDYLYPASITATAVDSTVLCDNQLINKNNYQLPADFSFVQDDPSTVTGGKKRRRRRSVPSLGRRVKRQAPVDVENIVVDPTEDRILSCAEDVPTLNCRVISCDIRGLQGGSSVQIAIGAFVDERFFSQSNDRFTFIPTATVSIRDAPYISSSSSSSTSSTAEIRAIPAGDINTTTLAPPFPWYAVVFPIIAVIIIIAIIAVILYFAGFFRRTKHEEIKQKREELQNLADNAVEPSAAEASNL